ncbi:MAG TPA: energy-coupling factor transporter transmembrane component T [Bacilli bacterium]|jgi:energy-coupling factor transport system permease protein|nr:energy-coupling factor transporter transmembrane component T [Bacilli bacterium]HQM17865.1 energy-coupling factor transporter transmembrane component T [Bacilli bacterium]
MGNKIVFGSYHNSNSWFHRLDPRTKLVGIFFLMIALFIVNNLWVLLGAFGAVLLLIITTKTPFLSFLKSIKGIAFILLFTIFFQIIFSRKGEMIWEGDFTLDLFRILIVLVLLIVFIFSKRLLPKARMLQFLVIVAGFFLLQYFPIFNLDFGNFLTKELATYKIMIYDGGLYTSLKIILRVMSILFISSLLTLTTKPEEITLGIEKLLSPLAKLKVNVSTFAMMISIALRYIPTLIVQANKILRSQASRGVDFAEAKLGEKIKQIISLLVPMFVIAYNQAEDLANAMEARGYVPQNKRSSINVIKFRFIDGLILILIVGLLATTITLKAMGYAI